MSEISISTNNLKISREARIDGALYEVRRIGPAEQLDISRLSSKLTELGREAVNFGAKEKAIEDSSQDVQAQALDEMNTMLNASATAQKELEDVYIGLFTGLDDKADPAGLVRRVGVANIPNIIKQVFDAKSENSANVSD